MTMTWLARYELAWPVTEAEEATLTANGLTAVNVDHDQGVTEVTTTVEAAGVEQATRKALAALKVAVPVAPHRLVVEAADAPPSLARLVTTKAFAERLGVSPSRVRQLADRPDFPTPAVEIPKAGALYHAADVHRFEETWDPDGDRSPGSRSRSDVAALYAGLAALENWPGLAGRDRELVTAWLAYEHGKNLNALARSLVDIAGRSRDALASVLDDAHVERVDAATSVAKRLLGLADPGS